MLDSALYARCAACHEVQHKQYQPHYQSNVDETGGHVKCEKSEQPENNQNRGEHPKHVFLSLVLVRENICGEIFTGFSSATLWPG